MDTPVEDPGPPGVKPTVVDGLLDISKVPDAVVKM